MEVVIFSTSGRPSFSVSFVVLMEDCGVDLLFLRGRGGGVGEGGEELLLGFWRIAELVAAVTSFVEVLRDLQ